MASNSDQRSGAGERQAARAPKDPLRSRTTCSSQAAGMALIEKTFFGGKDAGLAEEVSFDFKRYIGFHVRTFCV